VKREGVKSEKNREGVKREAVKNVVAGLKACEFSQPHKGCGYKNNAYRIPINFSRHGSWAMATSTVHASHYIL
jgi:hypothetical protein